MGLINRYILREMAVPCGLALVIIAFLAVVGELGEKMRQLPIEFVTSFDLLRLAVFFLPTLVSYVVPITFLIGVLLAFGRLAQTNEITAMRASGISLARILRPVLGMGLALSVGCFLIQQYIQPWAMGRAYAIQYQELPFRLTLDALTPGVMHQFGDWRVYFRSKDRTTRTLYDVDILIPEKDGQAMMYFAKSARVVPSGSKWVIQIENANIAYPLGETVMLGRSKSSSLLVPDVQPPKAKGDRKRYSVTELYQMDRLTELAREMGSGWTEEVVRDIQVAGGDVTKAALVPDSLKQKYPVRATVDLAALTSLLEDDAGRFSDSLKATREEIAERVSMPLACFAVALVAATLAVRSQQGARSHSYAIGLSIVFIYYVLTEATAAQGVHDLGEVVFRAMVPNLLFIAAGAVLLWRVDRV